MNLRCSCVLLSACLVLTACDSGSDESTSGSNSTSGGSTSGNDPTNVSVSVSISATTPTTDPATTDATEGDTEPTTTDPTQGETDSTTTDPTQGETDSTTDPTQGETGSTTTGGVGGTTIYDVQDGTVAEGETVTIEGVVITGLREGVGVTVQEVDGGEYSGVYVDTGELDLSTFAVGDIVDLTGETSENVGSFGLEDLTTLVVVDGVGMLEATGVAMSLAPEVVDFELLLDPVTAEEWESVLVSVTAGGYSAVPFGKLEFGEFGEFGAQSEAGTLLIDNFLYDIFNNAGEFPAFGEGASFTGFVGVLNYSFGNFKLAPRGAAELEGYVAPG